ncbi:MAG TPA: neutral/alkaline non-lysosomal ceramidase N-terminal domain-containing protein, partial [Chryseosolibacter sp.]|nr:neutral/alkaline non-lysosomal ceramidase N-terminal domain-containing protein [Chryseosolibacter sp.]
MIKKLLRFFLIFLLSLVVIVLVFVAVSVAPVDRTPADQQDFYAKMMARLDSIPETGITESNEGFYVGYAKSRLTPSYRTSTAGYSKRKGKLYSAIHDSVFVRTIVIASGETKVALVSADLLIIPPTVTAILNDRLGEVGFSLDNTYLGATHSHNSIGNWGEGAARFIYGAHDDSVVTFIAQSVINSIREAASTLQPAQLLSGAIPIPHAVDNRVVKSGAEDPYLRVLEIRRADSSRLVLASFTAHATCLYARDLELSRDYPGKLVDLLEQRSYDFAMFMAGAVGSHKPAAPRSGWDCVDWMATTVTDTFLRHRDTLRQLDNSSLRMERVPLLLPEPQVKIFADWKVRPWLFRTAMGEYPAYLTALRIGDVVMLG